MMSTELVLYGSTCRAVAAAHQVDEVKDIRDRAIALEHDARQARNLDLERQCREIRFRAELRPASCWGSSREPSTAVR